MSGRRTCSTRAPPVPVKRGPTSSKNKRKSSGHQLVQAPVTPTQADHAPPPQKRRARGDTGDAIVASPATRSTRQSQVEEACTDLPMEVDEGRPTPLQNFQKFVKEESERHEQKSERESQRTSRSSLPPTKRSISTSELKEEKMMAVPLAMSGTRDTGVKTESSSPLKSSIPKLKYESTATSPSLPTTLLQFDREDTCTSSEASASSSLDGATPELKADTKFWITKKTLTSHPFGVTLMKQTVTNLANPENAKKLNVDDYHRLCSRVCDSYVHDSTESPEPVVKEPKVDVKKSEIFMDASSEATVIVDHEDVVNEPTTTEDHYQMDSEVAQENIPLSPFPILESCLHSTKIEDWPLKDRLEHLLPSFKTCPQFNHLERDKDYRRWTNFQTLQFLLDYVTPTHMALLKNSSINGWELEKVVDKRKFYNSECYHYELLGFNTEQSDQIGAQLLGIEWRRAETENQAGGVLFEEVVVENQEEPDEMVVDEEEVVKGQEADGVRKQKIINGEVYEYDEEEDLEEDVFDGISRLSYREEDQVSNNHEDQICEERSRVQNELEEELQEPTQQQEELGEPLQEPIEEQGYYKQAGYVMEKQIDLRRDKKKNDEPYVLTEDDLRELEADYVFDLVRKDFQNMLRQRDALEKELQEPVQEQKGMEMEDYGHENVADGLVKHDIEKQVSAQITPTKVLAPSPYDEILPRDIVIELAKSRAEAVESALAQTAKSKLMPPLAEFDIDKYRNDPSPPRISLWEEPLPITWGYIEPKNKTKSKAKPQEEPEDETQKQTDEAQATEERRKVKRFKRALCTYVKKAVNYVFLTRVIEQPFGAGPEFEEAEEEVEDEGKNENELEKEEEEDERYGGIDSKGRYRKRASAATLRAYEKFYHLENRVNIYYKEWDKEQTNGFLQEHLSHSENVRRRKEVIDGKWLHQLILTKGKNSKGQIIHKLLKLEKVKQIAIKNQLVSLEKDRITAKNKRAREARAAATAGY